MHITHHCRIPMAAFAMGILFALVVLTFRTAPVLAGQPNRCEREEPDGMSGAVFSAPVVHTAMVPAKSQAVEWTLHRSPDGSRPSALEQQVLWLMNRARANPRLESQWLAVTLEPDVARAREFFQIDLPQMNREFISYLPKPPAAFDIRLYNAAREHSENLIARNSQDHDGQYDEVNRAGFECSGGPGYYFRGNVFAFAESGLNTHAAWNIDWGGQQGGMQPDRGHRMGVMSVDGELTNAGIAIIAEDDPETLVGPWVATANYCHAANEPDQYNRFLVGSVWTDKDGDKLYDPGEGIGGVTVRPEAARFYAVTGESGGYALPITRAGKYRVLFSGAVNGIREVEVKEESVLLDYVDQPPLAYTTAHTIWVHGGSFAAGATR